MYQKQGINVLMYIRYSHLITTAYPTEAFFVPYFWIVTPKTCDQNPTASSVMGALSAAYQKPYAQCAVGFDLFFLSNPTLAGLFSVYHTRTDFVKEKMKNCSTQAFSPLLKMLLKLQHFSVYVYFLFGFLDWKDIFSSINGMNKTRSFYCASGYFVPYIVVMVKIFTKKKQKNFVLLFLQKHFFFCKICYNYMILDGARSPHKLYQNTP